MTSTETENTSPLYGINTKKIDVCLVRNSYMNRPNTYAKMSRTNDPSVLDQENHHSGKPRRHVNPLDIGTKVNDEAKCCEEQLSSVGANSPPVQNSPNRKEGLNIRMDNLNRGKPFTEASHKTPADTAGKYTWNRCLPYRDGERQRTGSVELSEFTELPPKTTFQSRECGVDLDMRQPSLHDSVIKSNSDTSSIETHFMKKSSQHQYVSFPCTPTHSHILDKGRIINQFSAKSARHHQLATCISDPHVINSVDINKSRPSDIEMPHLTNDKANLTFSEDVSGGCNPCASDPSSSDVHIENENFASIVFSENVSHEAYSTEHNEARRMSRKCAKTNNNVQSHSQGNTDIKNKKNGRPSSLTAVSRDHVSEAIFMDESQKFPQANLSECHAIALHHKKSSKCPRENKGSGEAHESEEFISQTSSERAILEMVSNRSLHKSIYESSRLYEVQLELYFGFIGFQLMFVIASFIFSNSAGGVIFLFGCLSAVYSHMDRRSSGYLLTALILFISAVILCISVSMNVRGLSPYREDPTLNVIAIGSIPLNILFFLQNLSLAWQHRNLGYARPKQLVKK